MEASIYPASHKDFPFVNYKLNFEHQANEVPNSRKPGQTGHYYNSLCGPENFNVRMFPKFPRTIYEVFNRGLILNPKAPCLGWRPLDSKTGDFERRYVWQTYEEIDQRRTFVGSGLMRLAQEHNIQDDENGWRVGLWSHNRPEWQIVSKACDAYSLVTVSLYDTLGENVAEYCIDHAECRVIFCSPAHLPQLLKLKSAGRIKSVEIIVTMDPMEGHFPEQKTKVVGSMTKAGLVKSWAQEAGVRLLDFDEIEAIGKGFPSPHKPPIPETMISICYTSGTTGMPKGAILTHKSLTAAVFANNFNPTCLPGTRREVGFSFLPLSHIYERFIEDIVFHYGMPLGFSCGDNLRVLEDIQILKPTFFAAVPRVINRIYQALKAQTIDAPGAKGTLLRHVFAVKLKNLREKGTIHHPIYDALLLKKVRAVLGGHIRVLGTGSAPISPEILDFMRVAFSMEVNEGYGQTENNAMGSRTYLGDYTSSGTTGPPQVGVEIKLVDVPEMGYLSTDLPNPRGELCMRGDAIIPGYYRDEKKTKETIDEDGWLHSGDVGEIDSKGRIKIIDRIKNLVKLSQGEYVAVEKIENIYSTCPFVMQLYVHGDSLRDHLVAIVVPEPIKMAELAAKMGKPLDPMDVVALNNFYQDPKVNKFVLKELERESMKVKLNGFEKIKAIHMTSEMFSVDNDLLTPTFKVKRNIAAKYFKEPIDKMYDEAPVSMAKL